MQLDTFVAGALVSLVTLFGFSSPAAQTAAIAQSSTDGSCQRQYDYCMKNTEEKLRSNCEDLWKYCVYGKCAVSPRKQACVKDTDCKTSCTESATGKSGLLSCCQNAKHNNPCPTMIDWKCTKPGEAFPYAGGPKLTEGDTPPDTTLRGGDDGIQARPESNFKYPEGTTFDERGMPNQAPDPQPNPSGRWIDPNSQQFTEWQFKQMDDPRPLGEESLPKEYRPDTPYTPSTGERVFQRSLDGVIYSVPAESLSEAELKLYKEYPVYTSPSQDPYSGSPQSSGNSGNAESTFSEPNQQPAPKSCSWSLWGWCLWH